MAQDTDKRVMTAALAVIKINGVISGFMRNVRLSETINRGRVQGLGNLTVQEVPATAIDCSLTCDFFFISLARPEARAFLRRDQGLDSFLDTLMLGEVPVRIQIYRKVNVNQTTDGIVTEVEPEGKPIANIKDFYPTSQNWDISEQQISGMNISGTYLTPAISNE